MMPCTTDKPKAGAVILGGEKRIEDVRDIFAANAFAVVANRDAQDFVRHRRSFR